MQELSSVEHWLETLVLLSMCVCVHVSGREDNKSHRRNPVSGRTCHYVVVLATLSLRAITAFLLHRGSSVPLRHCSVCLVCSIISAWLKEVYLHGGTSETLRHSAWGGPAPASEGHLWSVSLLSTLSWDMAWDSPHSSPVSTSWSIRHTALTQLAGPHFFEQGMKTNFSNNQYFFFFFF